MTRDALVTEHIRTHAGPADLCEESALMTGTGRGAGEHTEQIHTCSELHETAGKITYKLQSVTDYRSHDENWLCNIKRTISI